MAGDSGSEHVRRTPHAALRAAMTADEKLLTVLHYGERLTPVQIAAVLDRSEDEVQDALARLHLRMGLTLDRVEAALTGVD